MLGFLETRVPPPLVMLLAAWMAYAAAERLPVALPTWTGAAWLAVLCVLGGAALNLLPKIAFRRAATTINPLDPRRTSSLVTTGIYRHTRNPMYLGHALILLGWAVYLQQPAALSGIAIYVIWVDRLQIVPEERVLLTRFADSYPAYIASVRRWL